jgi:hypothetical protein
VCEGEGFDPSVGCPTTVFKNPPLRLNMNCDRGDQYATVFAPLSFCLGLRSIAA